MVLSAPPAGSDSSPAPARVAIALGSNLGDRAATLHAAAAELSTFIDGFQLSSLHETDPVGVAPQPRFLNAAGAGTTRLSARALLDALLALEARHGRQRSEPGAARTLDLDLILYDGAIVNEPGLIVPHPRYRERAFVLEPLSEIAGTMVDPVTGQTVEELRRRLGVRPDSRTTSGDR